MTSKSSKHLIRAILGIHLKDLILQLRQTTTGSSLAVFQNIDALLTGVLQDAQDPDDIKSAYTNDLLTYLLGPLRHRTIESLLDNLLAVPSIDRKGPKNPIVVVSAAVREQASLDRHLNAELPGLLGLMVCRTALTDDLSLDDPIYAAASTGNVDVLLHLIKTLQDLQRILL